VATLMGTLIDPLSSPLTMTMTMTIFCFHPAAVCVHSRNPVGRL
jgi:hypothetical protein